MAVKKSFCLVGIFVAHVFYVFIVNNLPLGLAVVSYQPMGATNNHRLFAYWALLFWFSFL